MKKTMISESEKSAIVAALSAWPRGLARPTFQEGDAALGAVIGTGDSLIMALKHLAIMLNTEGLYTKAIQIIERYEATISN